ncbi:alkaline phosphatase family protein [Marinimicrobium agarilyticum]|uniref:alkaline phosphatase family protein n=1 Tax=Marinimicrobium agarilyticum TaxID=306546 RepID=UPI00041CD07C|nr:nucleotide pyrophosphatase/phosphodiesterase family protein [Marinimicrobium agarilyticum]
MHRTVVLNIVGLTRALLGEHTPNLNRLSERATDIEPVRPAVTCTAQATYTTGKPPKDHGIVANGWYFREMNEVWLWRQSNKLVQGPKVWHMAKERDPSFTCSNTFWWYAMATDAEFTLTPRPLYLADGRKEPDCYTCPLELRETLSEKFGNFPLFNFWGPMTNIKSSQWIADAAKYIEEAHQPSLQLVYLPHMDYVLQKEGPDGDIAKDLEEIDALAGDLLDFFEKRGCRVMVLSEYGIQNVSRAIHPNRLLREAGMLSVKVDLGREYLDYFSCRAFAVADHQIAHVYVHDAANVPAVRQVFEGVEGIDRVLDKTEQAELGLDHERSGELVLLAKPDSWFTYYFWQDDARQPDYAHQVEIHRKPGFDPCELFFDPTLRFPKLKAARRVAQKKLGFRYVMDVIAVAPELVKGSHGVSDGSPESMPLLMSTEPDLIPQKSVPATDVCGLMLKHLFD